VAKYDDQQRNNEKDKKEILTGVRGCGDCGKSRTSSYKGG
jgi:hypothetical protein